MPSELSINYIALGEKLRQKRTAMGLSQEYVSEKLNLSQAFYCHIERGTRILSLESLVKISRYYKLSLDYLLLDSIQDESNNKLHTEIENLLGDKTPEQAENLLKVFKILADNADSLG